MVRAPCQPAGRSRHLLDIRTDEPGGGGCRRRNFFDTPLTGVAEFAGLSVAAIVFLQLGAGILGGGMTRAGFLIDKINRRLPRLRLALDVVYALVGCIIFALLTYSAWPELVQSWRSDEFYGVRGIYMLPGWPFRALAVVGAAMATLAYLFLIPALLRRGTTDTSRASS
ncbi:TRAP transporter small permease [Alcanivorax sp. IO_7]|nr:TRAP transporter small permease [Alcanivorax sp. IO_7]